MADGEISSMDEAKRTAGASFLGFESAPAAGAEVCNGSGAAVTMMSCQSIARASSAHCNKLNGQGRQREKIILKDAMDVRYAMSNVKCQMSGCTCTCARHNISLASAGEEAQEITHGDGGVNWYSVVLCEC